MGLLVRLLKFCSCFSVLSQTGGAGFPPENLTLESVFPIFMTTQEGHRSTNESCIVVQCRHNSVLLLLFRSFISIVLLIFSHADIRHLLDSPVSALATYATALGSKRSLAPKKTDRK